MAEQTSAIVMIRLFEQRLGQGLTDLQVLGPNTLRTVTPGVDEIVGRRLTAVASLDDGTIDLVFGEMTVNVFLDRVGKAKATQPSARWAPGLGPMPTVRFLFSDESGIDLSESSRTKRIRLAITRPHA